MVRSTIKKLSRLDFFVLILARNLRKDVDFGYSMLAFNFDTTRLKSRTR